MNHILRAFLKVIHNRIYRENVMSQRCLDMNQDIGVCFIDSNKAFEKSLFRITCSNTNTSRKDQRNPNKDRSKTRMRALTNTLQSIFGRDNE